MGWGPGPGTKLYNFLLTRPSLKVKKSPTSPTPNIETAHLELEVVILDEVLNQLARHLDNGRPDDGRPPPLALGGPGGVVCTLYLAPYTLYRVHYIVHCTV